MSGLVLRSQPLRLNGRTPVVPAGVLGQLCFGAVPPHEATLPVLGVAMPLLEGRAVAQWLQWQSDDAVQAGQCGLVRYRHDDSLLFGVLKVPESPAAAGLPLQQAAERAYRAVFETLQHSGFPHLVRVWNYMADINAESDGLERYRHFNIGRQRAIVAAGLPADALLPAACALGTAAGPLAVAFLASRVQPVGVENPRQVSAFRYPDEYGPVSPNFARASVLQGAAGAALFVSGTAAIVGHQSLHPGDVVAQTRETLANIEAVLQAGGGAWSLPTLNYTVYVRHGADLDAVRSVMAEVAPQQPPLYVQADVCRAELLVEIEASAGHAVEPQT